MGKCSALGNENEIVFKNCRIFMARRAYCSCHKSRGCGRVRKMMNVYADFAENFMAIPVIKIKQKPNALLGLKKRIVSKL
jgi:hypothetical protein